MSQGGGRVETTASTRVNPGAADLIGAAMGKAVSATATPALPEDYDLDEEEPTDEDVTEVEEVA